MTESPRDTDTAAQIRDARQARGLSQDELANAIGVNRATVMRWETGRATPSPMAMTRVTELLNLTFDPDERRLLGLTSLPIEARHALVTALREYRSRQQAG